MTQGAVQSRATDVLIETSLALASAASREWVGGNKVLAHHMMQAAKGLTDLLDEARRLDPAA